jgi:hypothetical protein
VEIEARRGFVHFVRFRKTPVLLVFIRVHLRSSAANMGFGFRVGPEEKHIWPQMNADERG